LFVRGSYNMMTMKSEFTTFPYIPYDT
jgi:hypothetical protein